MLMYSRAQILNSSKYSLVMMDEAGSRVVKSCQVRMMKETDINLMPGRSLYLIYDDDQTVIAPAFDFMNNHDLYMSENSRYQRVQALVLFHTFLSLTGSDVSDFNADELIRFLQGINVMDAANDGRFCTRAAPSVNIYLSSIRRYLTFLGHTKHPLMKGAPVKNDLLSESGNVCTIRYASSMRVKSRRSDTPKYISPEEFIRLRDTAEVEDDYQSALIMELMYFYGLRIGEVLGLTVEDLDAVRGSDGKTMYAVLLRNRLSDKSYQYAKGLYHPFSVEEYASVNYRNNTVRVRIDRITYSWLQQYIEQCHTDASIHFSDNFAGTLADTVNPQKFKERENHYIFLNRNGGCLHIRTWGRSLRRYFTMCDIPVDTDKKENNLSHRFRHGFAMMCAHYLKHPVGIMALCRLMRHKSPVTTAVYYNPTPEDQEDQ